MNGPQRADELVQEITAILGRDDVTVTANPLEIPPALSDGRPVVSVEPPEISYPTHYATEATWDLYLIAGPVQDTRAAWETIAALIDALTVPLSIDTAKPASFAAPSMPQYPAYVLTFSETY